MKKQFFAIFMAMVSASAVWAADAAPAAEVPSKIDLNDPANYLHKYMIRKQDDGVLRVNGMNCIYMKQFVKPEAGKKYVLRGKARLGKEGEKTGITVGFVFRSKEGKRLPLASFRVIEETDAVLAKAMAKGDKSIVVKVESTKNWRPIPGWYVAFQAQKDLSDLPNCKLASFKKVTKNADGTLTVDLRYPAEYDMPEGTAVRVQSGYDRYMKLNHIKELTNEWQEFSFTISGDQLPAGKFNGKNFPAGIDGAELYIMVNWPNRKALTDLKDVVFEIQ